MVVACIWLIWKKVNFLFWNKNTINGTNIWDFSNTLVLNVNTQLVTCTKLPQFNVFYCAIWIWHHKVLHQELVKPKKKLTCTWYNPLTTLFLPSTNIEASRMFYFRLKYRKEKEFSNFWVGVVQNKEFWVGIVVAT